MYRLSNTNPLLKKGPGKAHCHHFL